jgi:predicted RecA/RadA family phage recombinase
MNNYVQQGITVTVIAPYAVNSGGGVLVAGTGHLFGIAVNNQNQGDNMEIVTQGVFDLAKDTSTFAEGDYVYWDNTNKVATSTATNNTKIGVAALMQASGVAAPGGNSTDPTVRVRLNHDF